MTSALMTDVEMAETLGISVDSVRRRCRAGQFPHIRIGRTYRFTPEDLAAIIRTHRAEQPAVSTNPWGVRRRRAS